jgi:hypothetical protein
VLTTIIDQALTGLAGLTLALIVWKAVELYVPVFRLRDRFEDTVISEIQVDLGMERIERGMAFLATIAATAPFVGLSATVLHIMRALTMLGGVNAEPGVIAGPIATALYSTLLGLSSAIPAAIAHNLLNRRLQVIENRARRRLLMLAQEAGASRPVLEPAAPDLPVRPPPPPPTAQFPAPDVAAAPFQPTGIQPEIWTGPAISPRDRANP